MLKKIFITATNTDIGKTYSSKLILNELSQRGLRVGAMKPIESGVKEVAQDAHDLLQLCKKLNSEFEKFSIFDICPYQFELPAAPYIANVNGLDIELSVIKEKIEQLSKACDVLIIEGAGGLFVPIKKEYFIIDLIKDLEAKTLLITHSSLGCINDTLLSLEALKNRNIEHYFAINTKENMENFEQISKKFFDDYFGQADILDRDIKYICDQLMKL